MESAAVPTHGRSRIWEWLDDRLGIGGLRYPVPKHANSLPYTLGGITLASFVGLVITGIYLAQFYDPTPERAHASVAYITDARPLGSDRGKALHESGRRFSPATGAQEVVGIAAGAALILLGALLLWRSRRVGAHA
jgi:LPXTG-motif cell wall-anchored protein